MEQQIKIDARDFLIFLNPHKRKLFNFIQKCTKFSEDAEDIYQNAVLNAYRAINKFKGKSTFKTWIFTIANHEVYRYYKKKKRDAYLRDPLENDPGFSADPEKELIRSLFEIALKFDKKYRNVFFLFYSSGFSLEEISTITGIKKGTVKYILNHCRENIKKKLWEVQDENK